MDACVFQMVADQNAESPKKSTAEQGNAVENVPMLLPNMWYQKLTHKTWPAGWGKLMSLAADETFIDDEASIRM